MKIVIVALVASIIINILTTASLINERTTKKMPHPCGCEECMNLYIEAIRAILPEAKKNIKPQKVIS